MLTRVVLVLLVALYSVALCRSEEATEVDLGRPDLEEMEKTGAILHNLVTLAQSHADRGEHTAAVSHLQTALEVQPGDPGLQLLLAHAHVLRGDYAAAQKLLPQVLKMLADDGDAHMLHGTVLEAQGDLKGALTAFDKAIGLMPDDPRPIVSSAVVIGKLGQVENALRLLDKGLQLEPTNAHALIYRAKLRDEAAQNAKVAADEKAMAPVIEYKQAVPLPHDDTATTDANACHLTDGGDEKDGDCGSSSNAYTARGFRLAVHPVTEAAVDSPLTYAAFREQFLETHEPVVLRGTASEDTLRRFALPSLLETCGDGIISPKETLQPWKWAGVGGQERHGTLRDFAQNLTAGRTDRYAFDVSLPSLCPELLAGWRMPKYFAQDLLQRLPKTYYYSSLRNHWPSLFLGPPGGRTDVHVDAWCSHFYMIMITGQKRWTFFPRSQEHYLEKIHLAGVYRVNQSAFIQRGDELFLTESVGTEFPLARLLAPLQVVLSPGDILFVPANTPHLVENIGKEEPTVAISGNFLDTSNLACATTSLEQTGLADDNHRRIAKRLSSSGFDRHIDPTADTDMPWEQFKGLEGQA